MHKQFLQLTFVKADGTVYRLAIPHMPERLAIALRRSAEVTETEIFQGAMVTHRVVPRLRGDEVIVADA
jgi:hypothetical protein